MRVRSGVPVALGRALGDWEHVGGAARPAARQPAQGQGVGAPLPGGQKLPGKHSACVDLEELAPQK